MRYTRAPYRILDCGGWTDTSFMPGGKGNCCNVAINLYVHVEYTPDASNELRIIHRANGKEEKILLPFALMKKEKPETVAEAMVAALKLTNKDGGTVTVYSDTPPGSGLGGSASYEVALITALNPHRLQDRHALAAQAQELEPKWLGISCGTQDQMAAAYGGISFSEITYPDFTHEAINPSKHFTDQLASQLLLVYTGESHFSSVMHHTVIEELERGVSRVVAAFETLKQCGKEAAAALQKENIAVYKQVVNQNWHGQKDLHKGITTPSIESLYDLVKTIDRTAAFKGCGAGGGGSVVILVPPEKKTQLTELIKRQFPNMKIWDTLSIDVDGASIQKETD